MKLLMMKQGVLNGRLENWLLLLSPYDIHFVPHREVKGQAIANFLAEHPILENSKLHNSITDEVTQANLVDEEYIWQLFFDGAARRTAAKVGWF